MEGCNTSYASAMSATVTLRHSAAEIGTLDGPWISVRSTASADAAGSSSRKRPACTRSWLKLYVRMRARYQGRHMRGHYKQSCTSSSNLDYIAQSQRPLCDRGNEQRVAHARRNRRSIAAGRQGRLQMGHSAGTPCAGSPAHRQPGLWR